ncbi:ABC-three component system middle component 1 [Trichococcus shcherbakoviae]|uniref:Uncharacterized protein n=1 Tax=Trichococcus shcherbakoviae subsp. psychrophilus TaxID=2585775 RepID=A0A5C5EAC0_9LACT|nr:ABC-three component system middle component 1 [Trichococcus shcherbakoviae]TNV69738.1 hypothetical protein FHK04_00395 [Trichococcus shcherbakoviae subsp. psychrophilus]
MKKFSKAELIEYFAENEFFVINTHIFSQNTSKYVFLYNETISKGIVLKDYNTEEELKTINEEIYLVRETLKELKFNIWNIYYFILVNNESEKNRKIYSIERDSRNMRKYVIQSLDDVNRVPFFKIKPSSEVDSSILIDFYGFIEDSQDTEINNVIAEIINSEGEYGELSKQKIRGILREKLSQGETL